MSLIISGDILGVEGCEEKIFYIKDKEVKGHLLPGDFFKTAGDKDFDRLTTEEQVLANQALESYILKLGEELPDGMIISDQVMAKIDLSKEKPVKKPFDLSRKDEKLEVTAKKRKFPK